MNNIVIIGFGPFGQALTKILLQANTESIITVVDIDQKYVLDVIDTTFVDQKHRLTWISSVDDIVSYDQAVTTADMVIVAVWSKFMTWVMQAILPKMQSGSCLVNVNKWLSTNWNICYEEYRACDRPDVTYATLAGGMAAYDVMDDMLTKATIAVSDVSITKKIKKCFESEIFACDVISDITWVEYAGVLKNIISIQAWYIQADQDIDTVRTQIDQLVAVCTKQIQDHAQQLGVDPSTFDQTYCRDHPEYGDIRTSCYGDTRNMRLGRERAKQWSLASAIHSFEQQKITVEGINTLRTVALMEDHPFLELLFVQDLMQKL